MMNFISAVAPAAAVAANTKKSVDFV